jgi:integrase
MARDDLVFAQANGRPIDKKADYDDWARPLKAASIRHVRLHDDRHTAATSLLSENVHPWVVMELLGHSRVRTTMDIYSHVMPALAREAADRMGTMLLTGKGRQTATTTATRDEIGPGPSDESPGPMGGAEGTRTPDPHMPGRLLGVRGGPPKCGCAGQRGCAVADGHPRTTVNRAFWPPSWHHTEAA